MEGRGLNGPSFVAGLTGVPVRFISETGGQGGRVSKGREIGHYDTRGPFNENDTEALYMFSLQDTVNAYVSEPAVRWSER